MSDLFTINLPRRFCEARGFSTLSPDGRSRPAWANANTVTVRATREDLEEILSDADYYSDPTYGKSVCRSARRTAAKIRKFLQEENGS